MSETSKEKKDLLLKGVTVNPEMKDYSNEPYFIKKAEEAKKVMDRYGLPKELLKDQK